MTRYLLYMGANDKDVDKSVFVPKTRVMRAGYVVDLNVWGGVCVFWQVTLADRGGGQLAG